MTSLRAAICAVSFAIGLAACGSSTDTSETTTTDTSTPAAFAQVDGERIKNARSTPGEWLTYGLTYDEQRYSLLDQVNKETVGELGVAWTYDLATGRGVESTPIVVDGTMYVTSAWSLVYALDAKSGEELWTYDPGVDRARGVDACCDVVNRGVAVWNGKVYVGTIDGRLVALDAKTGDVVWDKVTVDQSKPYTITGAPRVIKGRVLIGNGGAELGVRGYVSAYDAETGDMAWRFYTAPNPNKQPDGAASDSAFEQVANITWGDEGNWTEVGGGGTVWDAIVYEPDLNLIYIGVGNGSPWNQQIRDPSGGDNLFLSSIVALNADTGEYVWHFQTTPGETWDYTATQHIMVADLPLGEDGADRRVVMQAPKNGFFYVLDAATGEFISGEPFVGLNWATGLDENGRPIEAENARYLEGGFLAIPAPLGAHNWHPMAYNPEEQLVYIPAQEFPQFYVNDPEFEAQPGKWNLGIALDAPEGIPPVNDVGVMKAIKASLKGSLLAWDPVKQEARWSVDQGPWNGGVLATAGGLVFQGRMDGKFAAYDAVTGEELWSQNVHSGALSGPGTYEIDGEQYVTITTGWGTAFVLTAGFAIDNPHDAKVGKVVTFKVGGEGEIAVEDFPEIAQIPAAEPFGTPEMIAAGTSNYHEYCQVCHGPAVVGGGAIPELRWSAIAGNEAAWKAVVIDGSLRDNGMVSFGHNLTEDQAEEIRAYVLARANEDAAAAGGQP